MSDKNKTIPLVTELNLNLVKDRTIQEIFDVIKKIDETRDKTCELHLKINYTESPLQPTII